MVVVVCAALPCSLLVLCSVEAPPIPGVDGAAITWYYFWILCGARWHPFSFRFFAFARTPTLRIALACLSLAPGSSSDSAISQSGILNIIFAYGILYGRNGWASTMVFYLAPFPSFSLNALGYLIFLISYEPTYLQWWLSTLRPLSSAFSISLIN